MDPKPLTPAMVCACGLTMHPGYLPNTEKRQGSRRSTEGHPMHHFEANHFVGVESDWREVWSEDRRRCVTLSLRTP